jgi:hypothetical protein
MVVRSQDAKRAKRWHCHPGSREREIDAEHRLSFARERHLMGETV